ncbi:hypothetical protein BDV97DRAFT_188031 [Delphinella strobiligena]|nr:hypothetical protein BDV97DRAFT_188031 [Delphinella strobiligena]
MVYTKMRTPLLIKAALSLAPGFLPFITSSNHPSCLFDPSKSIIALDSSSQMCCSCHLASAKMVSSDLLLLRPLQTQSRTPRNMLSSTDLTAGRGSARFTPPQLRSSKEGDRMLDSLRVALGEADYNALFAEMSKELPATRNTGNVYQIEQRLATIPCNLLASALAP